jgi:hypothetical protein
MLLDVSCRMNLDHNLLKQNKIHPECGLTTYFHDSKKACLVPDFAFRLIMPNNIFVVVILNLSIYEVL